MAWSRLCFLALTCLCIAECLRFASAQVLWSDCASLGYAKRDLVSGSGSNNFASQILDPHFELKQYIKTLEATKREVQVASTVQCANHQVPVNWGNVTGDQISFYVQRFKQPGATSALFVFVGGPGEIGVTQSTSSIYPIWKQWSELEGIDIYTFNIRGGSSPVISCPTRMARQDLPPISQFSSVTAYSDCLAEMQSLNGANLQYYKTLEYMKDLKSFIDAETSLASQTKFGYGLSYGTLALNLFILNFPDVLTGAIYDGVAFGPFGELTSYDLNHNNVFVKLLELCSADSFCSGKLGNDPVATVASVFSSAKTCEHWPNKSQFSLANILRYSFLPRTALREIIFPLMYRLNRCGEQDKVFLQLFKSSFDYIDSQFDVFNPNLAQVIQHSYNFLVGLNYWLNEMSNTTYTSSQWEAILSDTLLGVGRWTTTMAQLYTLWPTQTLDYKFAVNTANISQVFASGTLDTNTPFYIAEDTYTRLTTSKKRFLTAVGGTHITLLNDCGRAWIGNFIRSGGDVDTPMTCLSTTVGEKLSFSGNYLKALDTTGSGAGLGLFPDLFESSGSAAGQLVPFGLPVVLLALLLAFLSF